MRTSRLASIRVLAVGAILATAVALGGGSDHLLGVTGAAASDGGTVVVQTMDSCKTALDGAVYELTGANGTFTAGTAGAPNPRAVSSVASIPCPLQQGDCRSSSTGCLNFTGVPEGDYRLIETTAPEGDSSNPDGYAPCEGGSACQWEAADVSVSSGGTVVAKVSNVYPNGQLVTWPTTTGSSVYQGTTSDPIVFHDFGLANPGTLGALCDPSHPSAADNYSTGTPSSECRASAATLAACPNSPPPHFPWTCMTDPNPVEHVAADGGETPTSYVPTPPANPTTAAEENWVSNLYHDVLARTTKPSASEISYWVAQMDDGATLAQIAEDFVGSSEAHGAEVNADYELLLGRSADPAGLAYWTQQLNAGVHNETLLGLLGGSTEFYQDNGDSDSSVVIALYGKILNRTATATDPGVEYWVGQLQTGRVPRSAIGDSFANSHEYHMDLVNSWYEKYLGRAADASGQTYWADYLDAGNSDDAGMVNILTSNEYYARPSSF